MCRTAKKDMNERYTNNIPNVMKIIYNIHNNMIIDEQRDLKF